MIDIHCHILPGMDDGSPDLSTSLAMARMAVDDGIHITVCTPHIHHGVYDNVGPGITAAVQQLEDVLQRERIPLQLFPGADVHIVPTLVRDLREGRTLSLAGSRYVLVEPPHHVPPPRLQEFLFDVMTSGYVPVLTHPERFAWIESHIGLIDRLANAGVWLQITAGSLTGRFGQNVRRVAERLLGDGLVHIIATDGHNVGRRPPLLSEARERARELVGAEEADHLVSTRPRVILFDEPVSDAPVPPGLAGRAHVESRRRGLFAAN